MQHSSRELSRIRIRLFVAAAAVAVVAALTLAPRSIVAPARGAFMRALDGFVGPLVAHLSYAEVEIALNALLFVPLGIGIALVLARRLWILAPLAGIAVSLAVEYVQVGIPGRVPDLDDVVWNGVGALVGALLVGLARAIPRRRHRVSAEVERARPPAR